MSVLGGGGADPVTVTSEAISVFGSSMIFSADTTTPFPQFGDRRLLAVYDRFVSRTVRQLHPNPE